MREREGGRERKRDVVDAASLPIPPIFPPGICSVLLVLLGFALPCGDPL